MVVVAPVGLQGTVMVVKRVRSQAGIVTRLWLGTVSTTSNTIVPDVVETVPSDQCVTSPTSERILVAITTVPWPGNVTAEVRTETHLCGPDRTGS